MQHRHIAWAKFAAGIAFFGAADAALGIGAMEALAELCLTSPVDDMAMPTMPMDHSGHAMPWLIAGGLFASFAGFGHWLAARGAERAPWAPRRLPLLAGLTQVARAQGTVTAAALAEVWNTTLTPELSETDAKIALARFATLSDDNRRSLMAGLTDKRDRAAFICMALRLLRDHGTAQGKALEMLETLAADSGMSGMEIFQHWDAAEAPSRAAIAVGEARALGVIAASTALARLGSAMRPVADQIGHALATLVPLLRKAGRGALMGFIRALSSPQPARGDDQLTSLRRRFRRRGLGNRLQTLTMSDRMPLRRGVS